LHFPGVELRTTDLPGHTLDHYAAGTGVAFGRSSLLKALSAFVYDTCMTHIWYIYECTSNSLNMLDPQPYLCLSSDLVVQSLLGKSKVCGYVVSNHIVIYVEFLKHICKVAAYMAGVRL